MVAAVGGNSKSSADSNDEARVRKQIRDRMNPSSKKRARRVRLNTTLSAFAEDDGEEKELRESETLGELRAMKPREAVANMSKFGEKIRKHLANVGKKATNSTTWIKNAWKNNDLYHQALVHAVIGLEYHRLVAEKRFAALDQVYALVTKVEEGEIALGEAIKLFDDTVHKFTHDRETIMHVEQLKRESSAARQQLKESSWQQKELDDALDEIEKLEDEQVEGDDENSEKDEEEEKEEDVDDKVEIEYDPAKEEDEEDDCDIKAEEAEIRADMRKVTNSLITVDLRTAPLSLSKREGYESLNEAVSTGATVTDVTRDLTRYARNVAASKAEASKAEAPAGAEDDAKNLAKGRTSLSFTEDSAGDSDKDGDDDETLNAFGRSLQQLSNAELRRTLVRLLRQRIWITFEDPSTSRVAMGIAIFFICLICISSISFCLETLPRFEGDVVAGRVFYGIEVGCIAFFTFEYVTRSLTCPRWLKFVIQPLNLVDLVALLPFYLQLMIPLSLSSIQVIRTIRLVRVLRILRLGVKFGRLRIIGQSISECSDMLIVSCAIGAVVIVIFSTLIYFTEHGNYIPELHIYARKQDINCVDLTAADTSVWYPNGTLIEKCQYFPSPFESIPASFWWCVVTLMTVGYGDNVPVTTWGRLVGGLLMVVSVLLLALPISVIGTEFTRQWLDYKTDSQFEKDKKVIAPRFQNLVKITKAQLKAAQETQQEMRTRQMALDDKLQTIKALIQRRNSETTFLKRKVAARTGLSLVAVEKFEKQLEMDDIDAEMRLMFDAHRDYRASSKLVKTIWGDSSLHRFSEFLINANHVLEGLCYDDFDMVSQEIDSLFFETWRVKSKLTVAFGPQGKRRWKRAGMMAKMRMDMGGRKSEDEPSRVLSNVSSRNDLPAVEKSELKSTQVDERW